jgi:hypothetical protein
MISLSQSKRCIGSRDEFAVGFDQAVSNSKTSTHPQNTGLKFEPLSNLCRSEKVYAEVYGYPSTRRSLRARLRACRLDGIPHRIVGERADKPSVHEALAVAVSLPYPQRQEKCSSD